MSVAGEPDFDMAKGVEVLGKVASPPNKESTCDEFYFWVRRDAVVERTQIVTTTSLLGNREVTFFALVREVFRQGRHRSLSEASDGYDGDIDFEPPFSVPGVTFAAATILRTEPAVLSPPMEGSNVVLGGEREARVAYAANEIEPDKQLALGIVKNGGTRLAGPGCIDLDYLLGENGGHINVNGVAGRGTKSSFLLHLIYLLEQKARRQAHERPSDPDRLRVVPIILNVKNFDLFFIDRESKKFNAARHRDDWRAMGISDPELFQNVEFLAPQRRGLPTPVDAGRSGVRPYSWSLADVIHDGLFRYLFADEDVNNENFEGLVLDVESRLTHFDRRKAEITRSLNNQDGAVRTFAELETWLEGALDTNLFQKHHVSTKQKFQRRLSKLMLEGDGVLRRGDMAGHPLDVRASETRGPRVIDLHRIASAGLRRFVVAAIFQQLIEERTGGRAVAGLRYLVMLDELNRFAPRNAHDPITRLIEMVAAEMRSQGIILLGAQQQASLVSTRVIENAGIRALGRSGSMEMNRDAWKFLGESARRKASALAIDEKLLVQDSFREPMLVRVPMPPWALNRQEARLPAAPGPRNDEFGE